MPELPEVETIVLGLRPLLKGHRIKAIETDWPKSLPIEPDLLNSGLNSPIIDVRRLGKMIIIDLKTQFSFFVHLKLTGQLVYRSPHQAFGAGHPNQSLIGRLPDRTTRVIFALSGQAQLFFNDQRKFGWVKLLPTSDLTTQAWRSRLGPDALSLKPGQLFKILKKRTKNLKACLLDQTLVAGCGNIYADESLWLSQLHPQVRSSDLTKTQFDDLTKNLIEVLKLSLSQGGSSSRNYVNAQGERGQYLTNFAKVYQRQGLPCRRCQTSIVKIKIAGRGTHICPKCQVLKND